MSRLLLSDYWKKGALTIAYKVYGGHLDLYCFLYEKRIGHATLNPSRLSVQKEAMFNKAKTKFVLIANFSKQELYCEGEICRFDMKEKWVPTPIDEVIVKWEVPRP